jgi:hypothetical protein
MPAHRSTARPRALRAALGALPAAAIAVLVCGAVLAMASTRSGKYSGATSEGGAVTLTVAPGGRAITHFHAVLGYNGKCGPGGGPGLTAAPVPMTIQAGGSFSRNVTLSLTGIANPIHDPGRVFGKVSGSKVTGTVEQFLQGKVNKCYVETFTAKRQ